LQYESLVALIVEPFPRLGYEEKAVVYTHPFAALIKDVFTHSVESTSPLVLRIQCCGHEQACQNFQKILIVYKLEETSDEKK
jgi:hypothetical protein